MHSQISELKQQVSRLKFQLKYRSQNVQQNNTITQVNKQTTDNNQTSKNSTTNIDKQNQTTTVARTIKTNSQINKVARRILFTHLIT